MKSIYKALADFQQECPIIHKGTKGYGYTYADLPAIFEVINPLLKKHGLGFTQLVGSGDIKTILFHTETAENIEVITKIPEDVQLKGMNEYQVLGSAITYIRRYALSSMLGIVTDKDTDASGQQKPKQAPKKEVKKLPLLPDTDKWESVLDFLVDGGDINKVKSKFTLTKENEDELIKQTMERQ